MVTHEEILAKEKADYESIQEHITKAENGADLIMYNGPAIAHALIAIAKLLDNIDGSLNEAIANGWHQYH